MKKILTFVLIILSIFLSSCVTNIKVSNTIYLEDAFSVSPYITLISSNKEYNKYKADIEKDLSSILTSLDEKFDVHNSESYVSQINKNAGIQAVKVDDEVIKVLNEAILVSMEVTYKYDVTIYPLVKLWGFNGSGEACIPSVDAINEVLPLIDYKKIKIEGNSVYLEEKGMMIDLGSIVKGYACDLMANKMALTYPNFDYIINVGGNIYTYGNTIRNNKKDDIHVGITTPFYTNLKAILNDIQYENCYYIGYIKAKSEGTTVVTSGTYERYITDDDGNMYHHILDPNTGMPFENNIDSLTVIMNGENVSMTSDALSTALFSLGINEALNYANNYGIGIVIVTKDKKIYISNSIKDVFVYNEVLNSAGYEYINNTN